RGEIVVIKIKKMINFLKQIRWLTIILPMLLLGVFIFLVSVNNIHTETYDIEKFAQTKETIRSHITVENKVETNRKIRDAISAVEDHYLIDDDISEERMNYVEELFDALEKLEEEAEYQSEEDDLLPNLATDRDKVLRLGELLSDEISKNINDSTFVGLIHLSEREREIGLKLFEENTSKVFESGVRTSNIQRAISDIKQSIRFSNLDDHVKEAFSPLADFVVVENSFFDPDKTSQAEKEAANNVE